MEPEKIAPLQDAVDLDIATDDEKAQFDEGEYYIISISLIFFIFTPAWGT